jgi:hypothetical protein
LSAAQAAPDVSGEASRPYSATAIVRAIDAPSAAFLAATTESFTVDGGDDQSGGVEALTGAGTQAGGRLAALLGPAWLSRKKEDDLLRLEVEGTRALAEFVRFRSILKKTAGVRGIQMEVLRPDQAVIAVNFDGNGQSLAAKLLAHAYPSFGIDIYDLTGARLKVKLTRVAGNN